MWGLPSTRTNTQTMTVCRTTTPTIWDYIINANNVGIAHKRRLSGLGEGKRCVKAHSVHDTTRCHPGRTLAAVYGRATSFGTAETDKDKKTGLRQLVWVIF